MSARHEAPRPPRRLEAWLTRRIPDGAAGPSVLGDLHEEYLELHTARGRRVADAWYAGQVLGLGLPWAAGRVRTTVAGAATGWMLDAKASVRGLRRHPALVLVAVISLSLGSGLVTAAATVTNGAWFAPLPWPAAERLVDLEDWHPTEVCRGCSPGTSLRAFTEWRDELGGVFDRVGAVDRRATTLRTGDVPIEVVASVMTADMAEILDLRPAIGRMFGDTDADGADRGVAVLTHGLWRRAFGEDPAVIGREVEVGGVPHVVIGVLTEDARPLSRSDLVLPLPLAGAGTADYADRSLWVVGRLADGIDVSAADDAVGGVAARLFAEAPGLEPGWTARATPLREVLARSGASPGAAGAMFALCLIVLLVSALNLAALLMARVTRRAHELGVRTALGAGRLRVARAAVLDSLLLSAAGGLGGVLLTWTLRDAVVRAFSTELPPWVSFPIDLRVLAVAVGGVALTALVTGLLPLVRSLATGRGETSASRVVRTARTGPGRAQDLLLGAQIVLGIVLVAGSVGSVRAFRTVSDFDRLGRRWEGLANVTLSVGDLPAAGGTAIASLAGRLDAALASHPGLEGHTVARSLFLGSWGTEDAASPVHVTGAPEPMRNDRVPRHSLAVGPGYFDLDGIPILAGRGIADTDDAGASPAAVVSEDAARAMWPDRATPDVVGQSFAVTLGTTSTTFTVVGVSRPIISRAWSESGSTDPMIYTSILQTPDGLFDGTPDSPLLLRVDPRGATPGPEEWAAWLGEVAPDAALTSVVEIEEILRESIRGLRLTGWVLGGLSALVLALLSIGIFGSVSYRVASIRREIGIRIALGADGGDVVRAVGARLLRLVALSTALGAGAAFAADRLLSAGGVPIGNADPSVLVSVAVLISAAAAVACALPLRTALRIDPVRSLRME